MNETEIVAALEGQGAVQHGHFKLSSGLHSDLYVQCALALRWPGIAERLGHELGSRCKYTEATVVLAPAMGGLIIGHEVARQLDVPMVFSERVEGRMTMRRGFVLDPTQRVLVIEDVVTTGRSQLEVLELASGFGATVVGVGAIVDRSDGAAFGVPFESLIRMRAQNWTAGDCPLCERREAVTAPGSRHL